MAYGPEQYRLDLLRFAERQHQSYFRRLQAEVIPIPYSPEWIVSNGIGRLGIDVDQTLTNIEGINELARMHGVLNEVEKMTHTAMNGERNLPHVMDERLEKVKPNRSDLVRLGDLYIQSLNEDAEAIVSGCLALGIDIHLISGGYKQALDPLADHLGISRKSVHSNVLRFTQDGKYTGFHQLHNPLITEVGKAITIFHLSQNGNSGKAWGMVGDGITDLEGGKAADVFIGYGGVISRKEVVDRSPIFIKCRSLAPLFVLSVGEQRWQGIMNEDDDRMKELLLKGMRMIVEGQVVLREGYEILYERVNQFLSENNGKIKLPDDDLFFVANVQQR